MIGEIRLPPQIYIAPNNVFWNNLLVITTVGENFVIDIASLRYKDATIFDNFDVGTCQLVLDKPYQHDLNLYHKSRKKKRGS